MGEAAISDVEKRGRDAHRDRNFGEAAALLQQAAERCDSPTAAYLLGFMYVNGRGVPKSESDAAKWWRKAADLGDVRGIALAAECDYAKRVNGRLVIVNDHEYVGRLVKAFELGLVTAAHDIAVARGSPLARGRVDHKEAYKWFLLDKAAGGETWARTLAVMSNISFGL